MFLATNDYDNKFSDEETVCISLHLYIEDENIPSIATCFQGHNGELRTHSPR